MEARSLKFIATACEGRQLSGSPDVMVSRVCTDSRQAHAGDLFIALRGERFEGHDYLGEAIARGVAAVVAADGKIPGNLPACPVIAVEDTRRALGRLAARYRDDFTLPVIAVAGSNGKTTTKELIAAVLREKLATLWSEASFNNDIGVPLTLLRLDRTHQAAVLEAGTNHPGELAPLLNLIRPRYGVLTNVGREHLEFFGNIGGVAAEEGQLAEALPSEGALFVNGDDEWTPRIALRARAAVVRVGLADGNDWRASRLRLDPRGMTFQVEAPATDFSGEYRIQLLGKHQVVNALFALAIGMALGLSRAEVERGLAGCRPPRMRLQFYDCDGVLVLDDAYNANADSMLAALETLLELPCQGRRIAVLGDMAELGAAGAAAHEEVGRRAAEMGVGQLFAVGNSGPVMARAARAAGLNRVLEFPDVETASAAVRSFVRPGDVVLLKASRALRLERVASALRAGAAPRND